MSNTTGGSMTDTNAASNHDTVWENIRSDDYGLLILLLSLSMLVCCLGSIALNYTWHHMFGVYLFPPGLCSLYQQDDRIYEEERARRQRQEASAPRNDMEQILEQRMERRIGYQEFLVPYTALLKESDFQGIVVSSETNNNNNTNSSRINSRSNSYRNDVNKNAWNGNSTAKPSTEDGGCRSGHYSFHFGWSSTSSPVLEGRTSSHHPSWHFGSNVEGTSNISLSSPCNTNSSSSSSSENHSKTVFPELKGTTTTDMLLSDTTTAKVFPHSLLSSSLSCAICLADYQPGDTIVWSSERPTCLHAFHQDCILTWLSKGKKKCPVCRNWFVPKIDFSDLKEQMMILSQIQPSDQPTLLPSTGTMEMTDHLRTTATTTTNQELEVEEERRDDDHQGNDEEENRPNDGSDQIANNTRRSNYNHELEVEYGSSSPSQPPPSGVPPLPQEPYRMVDGENTHDTDV